MKKHNLKVLRVMRDLTQEELANKCGVSRAHIARIELGQVQPSIKVAQRIAEVLQCSLNEFIEGDE